MGSEMCIRDSRLYLPGPGQDAGDHRGRRPGRLPAHPLPQAPDLRQGRPCGPGHQFAEQWAKVSAGVAMPAGETAYPAEVKPARLGSLPSRWGQAVSWRLCRLETAGALWVLRRLTDGAGRTAFSFVGKRGGFTLQLFFACPARAVYPPTRQGAKTTFSFDCKRKSGSGLRKRKGRPVKMITGYGTTG